MKNYFFSVIGVVVLFVCFLLPSVSVGGPQDQWHYVTTWTGYNEPMGMAEGTNGLIFIAEYGGGCVRVIDGGGNTVTNWMGLTGPYDVAVATNGLVYVTEQDNHMVKVFDHDGNYVTNWGGLGTGDGQFNTPTTVSILPTGNVRLLTLIWL